MSKVEGGDGPIDPPPPSRPRVAVSSSRLLGLNVCIAYIECERSENR